MARYVIGPKTTPLGTLFRRIDGSNPHHYMVQSVKPGMAMLVYTTQVAYVQSWLKDGEVLTTLAGLQIDDILEGREDQIEYYVTHVGPEGVTVETYITLFQERNADEWEIVSEY